MNLDERIIFSDPESFNGIKRYYDGGNTSITYTGSTGEYLHRKIRDLNENSKYYFKANNSRGVNFNQTDESRGSCEDVAEVFSYYIINNLQQKCGIPIVGCAKYHFAEMSDPAFKSTIYKLTSGLIDNSERLYGCLSENVLMPNQNILRGNNVLGAIIEGANVYKSANNTLINYSNAIKTVVEEEQTEDRRILISPSCDRYLADMMMIDYFLNNTDRHCKNINFKRTELPSGKIVVEPMEIIDNGACFGLQSINCFERYKALGEELAKSGGVFSKSPFDRVSEFTPGRELFANEEDREKYSDINYVKALAMMVSSNRVLFEDFKAMYNNIDIERSYKDMYYGSAYENYFLPNFKEVISASIDFKRMEISEEFAKQLGVEFNEDVFRQNPSYYVDQIDEYMQENEIVNNLAVNFATNEEIENFNSMLNCQSVEE